VVTDDSKYFLTIEELKATCERYKTIALDWERRYNQFVEFDVRKMKEELTEWKSKC
jgi:hypothetical protein